jgi:1,4-alpha-glucan branching enzyme
MAKKSSKKVRKSLAAYKPSRLSAAVNPVDKLVQNHQQGGLTESVMMGTQAMKPTTQATSAVRGKAPTPAAQSVNVTFVLLEPDAKQVFLSGDFNGWASNATTMRRHSGGLWETTVALAPGRHQYKFVVDGEWIPDPSAQEHVWNQHGTLNSVIEL